MCLGTAASRRANGAHRDYVVTEERACDAELIKHLFDLLKSNMEALYGDEWSDGEKRDSKYSIVVNVCGTDGLAGAA
eukprot:3713818-Pyramimonas_sp.AAC.2